jgi:hypothetical protein
MEIQKVFDRALCRHILDDAASALDKPLGPPALGMIRHDLEILCVRRKYEDALTGVGAMKRSHSQLFADLKRQHRIIAQDSSWHGAQIRSNPAWHRGGSTRDLNGA